MKSVPVSASDVHGGTARLREHAQEAEQYLEGWKRARADYENLHGRSVAERRTAFDEGVTRAFQGIVGVLDHFDAAFASVPEDVTTHAWVEGVRQVHRAFLGMLAAEGIVPIDDAGSPFDPTRHEAVAEVPSGQAKGAVVDIVARGYTLNGKVIRPAKVTIASGERATSKGPAAASASRGDAASQPSTLQTSQRKEA
jgi:molecular chaperone GrpE